MKNKQQDKAMGKLHAELSAATIFTQQPGIESMSDQEDNNTLTDERNNGIHNEIDNYITEEDTNDTKRGPKKKGEFKKVTLNIDVDLNRKLDAYINTLRGKAIEEGTEPPNKSEWVRDIIEEKLRELGTM